MNAQMSMIRIIGPEGEQELPAMIVSFDELPNAMAPADQAMELRIKAQGLLMHADLVDFELTKDPLFHESAERNRKAMYALINSRSPERKAQMAAERGLPHA